MDTLTIVLYSLSQWSEYAGHPMSVYWPPVTGCKSGVRARIYTASHKPNTIVVRSVVVSCWSCIRMLNFVSGGLLTYFWRFRESSPVQPVHFSPVISDTNTVESASKINNAWQNSFHHKACTLRAGLVHLRTYMACRLLPRGIDGRFWWLLDLEWIYDRVSPWTGLWAGYDALY